MWQQNLWRARWAARWASTRGSRIRTWLGIVIIVLLVMAVYALVVSGHELRASFHQTSTGAVARPSASQAGQLTPAEPGRQQPNR